MPFNLFSKTKHISHIGIDLGTAAIKVVELGHHGGDFYLNNYAEYYLKPTYLATHSSTFHTLDGQIASILKETFKEGGFEGKSATVAIPISSSFSTLIELPMVSQEELESAVRFEARKYIPAPMGQVQFDWIKVEHLSTDERVKILTVAVPNEITDRYRRIEQMLGISFENMELETFSSARAFIHGAQKQPALILDIGARTTNVGIVEKGMVVMHHNIEIAGVTLTRTLARGLAIDLARAEELKKTLGIDENNQQVAEILRPPIDKIILEIQQVIQDYLGEGGQRIAEVIITGGGGKLKGLDVYIQKALNISTHQGNPLQYVKAPAQLKEVLKERGPEFAVALGLAMRQ